MPSSRQTWLQPSLTDFKTITIPYSQIGRSLDKKHTSGDLYFKREVKKWLYTNVGVGMYRSDWFKRGQGDYFYTFRNPWSGDPYVIIVFRNESAALLTKLTWG